ncbi:MSHA biogenesis protein MshP [Marinimicrobium koreense]|uniref:MSHA biogenesis protein MshP n=2 Tax=Marinimicrobium koreense TaxID=306545 RepID=A0A3N1NZA3_9GAMM|nr:MSHA biogenesis protein MshP [Marinimicrobium koreense]
MSPDLFQHRAMRKQDGFLLPVALFIIVVMGFASLALWRTTSQSSIASVQEVVTVQALYAAESAVQRGLSELFYPNANARPPVDNRCASLNTSIDFSGINGLNLCTAQVQCELAEPGLYNLSASSQCGSGPTRAVRSLTVQARF